MNTPTGIQVPATLLPAIDGIIGNELVVLFVQPGADRVIVEDHWRKLKKALGGLASFHDFRGPAESEQVFNCWIHNLRKSRDEQPKPRVIIYNFSPRFSRVEQEADISFFYCQGHYQVNLQRGKLRRAVSPEVPRVLELLPPKTVALDPVGQEPESLQVIITGNRARSGKTALAVMLCDFLKAHVPQATIEHYSSEGDGLADKPHIRRQVKAKVIQIIDTNARPMRAEALEKLDGRRH